MRASRLLIPFPRHCLLLILVLATFAAGGWADAFEVDDMGFPTPVPDHRFLAQPPGRVDLTDEIEGKETLVQKFLNLTEDPEAYVGFSVFAIAGAVFAYLVNAKSTVSGQATYGFMLLDSDGDGIFERKYSAAETAEVPPWVIERALKLMEESAPAK